MNDNEPTFDHSGIISPEELIWGYSQGIFPMSDDANSSEVMWYTAIRRGVIPMDAFKVSSNVMRIIRKQEFVIKFDHDFEQTIRACANRSTTWISESLIKSYTVLHRLGYAHSVEVWSKDESELLGGLYGVKIGRAFFGESMFKRKAECDKIALYYCHLWLKEIGVELWDTQFWTEHLAQFGCIEISAVAYQKRLKKALRLVEKA